MAVERVWNGRLMILTFNIIYLCFVFFKKINYLVRRFEGRIIMEQGEVRLGLGGLATDAEGPLRQHPAAP